MMQMKGLNAMYYTCALIFGIEGMIVVTGAAGFIASCLIARLNEEGYFNLVAVDDFSREDKEPNLRGKKIHLRVERKDFPAWLEQNQLETEFVFHLGARTDTTEQSVDLFTELNLNYSKQIWAICTRHQIPLIYASSAATYGNGDQGYSDDESSLNLLQPLNPYAHSKHEFDKWVISQSERPFFWSGLKFFNVYGPNEYHKGKMASVIYHAFQQISETGEMKLFESHRKGIEHGHQMRDFVYVKDVVEVCLWLMHHRHQSQIYNLGSGKARTFLDLALATFHSMNRGTKIKFIPTPESIRNSYQYFTEADMSKLKNAGYEKPFTELENGIDDYVKNFLITGKYL